MRDLYWLADEPMARLSPYCPKIGGKLRVAALLDDLPQAQRLLGDRGHAADWFRGGLGVQGCRTVHLVPNTCTEPA